MAPIFRASRMSKNVNNSEREIEFKNRHDPLDYSFGETFGSLRRSLFGLRALFAGTTRPSFPVRMCGNFVEACKNDAAFAFGCAASEMRQRQMLGNRLVL
jgi:hypothetical protein